jgi:putative nucleotidyltransferase with HDIG domain
MNSPNTIGNMPANPAYLDSMIRTMLSMVEAQDAYTAAHQRNVSNLACMVANQLGWNAMRIEGLRFAALIHDIGKISIPSQILHKPTMLSELEFKFIKMHCITGSNIVENIESPWPLARIILEHHERLDGSGYPYGIKGDSILLESQVLSVADVVDAIIMHRPYRPAIGMDAAISEIENHKNTAFNGDVVEVCTRILKNNLQ